MDFLRKLLSGSKPTATTSGSTEFLSSLTHEERLAVNNLNPIMYESIIKEKKGESNPNIISENENDLRLLRKLDIPSLERLNESVKCTMKADSLSLSNISEAAKFYQKASEINPYNDLALMSCGVAFARQRNLREGIKWIEKALSINPNNERARRNLEAMKRDLH